jgi:PAS domain S-box-containing protein
MVFESESDAIMIFDGETRQFVDVNNAADELYGYTHEEFLKLTHGAINAEPEVAAKAIPATLAGHPPPTFASCHRKKDGTVFPVEITGSTFIFKNRPVVCGVIRDITRRMANEQEILRNREELRRLASELSLAGQRERQRIATELHDSVSQLLACCCLRLDDLKTQRILPEPAKGPLESVCEILKESIRQTQALTFELSCPLLDELGLEAALDELCLSLTQKHAVIFEFEGGPQPRPLSRERQLILYRAARELLMNVIKHSGAQYAGVTLTQTNSTVRICVEDDGAGFDASAAGTGFSTTGGFGLFNLKESMHHAGGALTIESDAGHGTRAILTLPLEK